MFRQPTILTFDNGLKVATGWVPSVPDLRDYDSIKALSKMSIDAPLIGASVPSSVDLRTTGFLSPIEDQGQLGSCAAQAGVGMIEYMERRAFGKHVDASALALYKYARNLLGWPGDAGSTMRTVMAAVALLGVPPEKYWPYTTQRPPHPDHFDRELPAWVGDLGDGFKALVYFRYDNRFLTGPEIVDAMRRYLAIGIPQIFGFIGFNSWQRGNRNGWIPYPCPTDYAQWGHGVMTAGYDDDKVIENLACPSISTTGAFLFRNSWGPGWGEAGYGWLPYQYFLDGFAWDIWSWVIQRWVGTGAFGL